MNISGKNDQNLKVSISDDKKEGVLKLLRIFAESTLMT
jgi:hypothetical protein